MLSLLMILLPMVLIGTLLALISASVTSVKDAQSYMSVLMLLPREPEPSDCKASGHSERRWMPAFAGMTTL